MDHRVIALEDRVAELLRERDELEAALVAIGNVDVPPDDTEHVTVARFAALVCRGIAKIALAKVKAMRAKANKGEK